MCRLSSGLRTIGSGVHHCFVKHQPKEIIAAEIVVGRDVSGRTRLAVTVEPMGKGVHGLGYQGQATLNLGCT